MNGLQETNVYAFSGLSNGEYDNLNADTINTQELYIDGVLFDVSGIDLTNYVTTSQLTTQLTPINNNIATNTTDISGLKFKTTNISYNSNVTTFTGSLTFPNNSISRAAVSGGAVDIITAQTISAQKTMSALFTCTSNLRLDGSLILGTNTVTITNLILQKTQYLSNITYDINSKFNDYVLSTTLSGYVTSANLSSQLSNYVLSSYLSSQLSNYVTSSG